MALLTAGHSVALGPPPCDPTSDPGCGSAGDGPTTVQVKLTVASPSQGKIQDDSTPTRKIDCGNGSTDCTETYSYTLDCSVDPCVESDVKTVTLTASGGPTGDTPRLTVCDSNFTGSTCANSQTCGTTQCTLSMRRSYKVSLDWEDHSPPTQPIFTTHPAKLGPSGGFFTATSSDNIAVTQMQFSVDSTPAGTDTSAPFEQFVFTATYADGSTHTVRAVAQDGASNESIPSDPVSFTVDKSTAVAIQSPPAGASFKTPPQFSFSRPADFASASCETLSGPSGNNVVGSGSCNGGTYTPQSGPDGIYRIRVTVTDDVGNQAADERSFQIDTVAPTLQVTAPANGSTVASPVTPAYSAFDAVSGTQVAVSCKLETEAAFGACGPMSLAPGPHALTVRASDLAGNETDQTMAFTVQGPAGPGSPLSIQRRVSISLKHGLFSGSVRPRGGCASAEKVRLYEVKRGPDPVVGRASTKPSGRWSIHAPRGGGRFYVKVKPSRNGDQLCRPARSKTLRSG